MQPLAFLVVALLGALPTPAMATPAPSQHEPEAGTNQVALGDQVIVDQYCAACHNDRAMTGNLSLESVTADRPEDDAETWEKVIRKLRGGLMPPSGAPRPEGDALETLRRSLESGIDRAALDSPHPGATDLHRMNRSEYGNAIRDLVGIEIDAATMLPPDDSFEGLDNIADVLGTSPALVERYVTAAAKISRLAVGNTDISPMSATYRPRGDLSQDKHIPGLPYGTRGGIRFDHYFPVDGEYTFKFSLLSVNFGPRYGGAARNQKVELAIDGERTALIDLLNVPYYYIGGRGGRGGPQEAPLEVTMAMEAGPKTITVTFIEPTSADVDDLVQRAESSTGDLQTGVQFGYTTVPHLRAVDIIGPYNVTGPGATPSRERIFICRPTSAAEETVCAREIVGNLARRAFRRPVSDRDVDPFMAFYRSGYANGGFESGVEMALRRILADPEFVFRFERAPSDVAVGDAYPISGIELASRLSFFLWSSIPDEELLELAEAGRLQSGEVLAGQVRRMLEDPRSDALIENFAGQWLFIRELDNRNPDLLVFPDFDHNLREAFARETGLLFETIVREDRSVFEILDADYTFVNERLARHYGIPNVYGEHFRRITVDDSRRGLFGHGSFLVLTSLPNRTSPVMRGAWVLENILGSPPPQPPPNVPALPENVAGQGVTVEATSVRERMVAHRVNQPCRGCHQLMDPIGLALENFDAVGRWRTEDSGFPVDVSGELVDGTPVNGVDDLRDAILARPDAFAQALTQKLLSYAVGRGIHYDDMPAVRAIARAAAENDYRFSSLVLSIAQSDPFRMRVRTAEDTLLEDTRLEDTP
jgi:hypothetical protein